MVTTALTTDRIVRVLLVDDDEGDYLLTRDLFEDLPGEGYRLEWVSSYAKALDVIGGDRHDLYLFDYLLGAKTGIDLLHEVHARECRVPVIVLTGKGEYEIDRKAMQAGAADYLEKGGLTPALLERSIRYALQQHRYEAELERQVRERTEELAQANAALREADRRKDEFLATLAHELRNPLAPIRNALEIMRLAFSNPDALERARAMMDRQVAQMVRLIDDLLDVSRITSGKLRLSPEVVYLDQVMAAAVEISDPLLQRAKITLTQTLPGSQVRLIGDRVRLAQVFSNLLNNAAKYSEPGGMVSLTAAIEGDHVVVRIRDTGIGIPPEVIGEVFQLFTQVDRSLNRSQGGLGIGLALVHCLTVLHGGTVTAASDGVGKGAEFTVRLPLPGKPGALVIPKLVG